jgi:hypothetical protein
MFGVINTESLNLAVTSSLATQMWLQTDCVSPELGKQYNLFFRFHS